MQRYLLQVMCFVTWLLPSLASAQNLHEREAEFLDTAPLIGEPLPEVNVYSADGRPFLTSNLRGHYTVLTFGCLTCPPSMWSISGLEAVYRDYAPKGVEFFFIYKSLAHPELAGNYIQPFTLEERMAHATQAKEQFGTQIPWVVDAMDNRLKRALGDRPNSQFLIDPQGIVVRKRAWSNPALVRADLEELVGPVDQITREEDLSLKFSLPLKDKAMRNVVPRVARTRMTAIVTEPVIEPSALPFYAKLRAEASADLLSTGKGEMYIGFHLDPFQGGTWNNLAGALAFRMEASENTKTEPSEMTASLPAIASDADPREFFVEISAWPVDEPLTLVVNYFVCASDETCLAVEQRYRLHRKRDIDGGGARGAGAGYWDAEGFVSRLLLGDENDDGKIAKLEAAGIILPHFDKLDSNHDGLLEQQELSIVADWLNHHHQPGVPQR